MSDQWVVDVADIDEKNCVIRIFNMHCPECGYDPLANTASSITIPGPERTEDGTYFINALNIPKTLPTCPKCGKVLSANDDEKKKKTFLVEMDSAPVMGINGGSCTCPVCLSGPHPMCLIAGAQVENLDHCPVLKEADWRGLVDNFMHAFDEVIEDKEGDELTQFQRDLIRMWDSMREDCKGNDNCSYVSCSDCPLYDEVCYDGNEISGLTPIFDAEKAIKIVTQWAKDHPVEDKEDNNEPNIK